MSDAGPTRSTNDLADVVELLLDKGVVINADIAVSVGDTELLGIRLRAAVASFETAAEYGLEFPSGTDMRRVDAAADREALDPAAVGPAKVPGRSPRGRRPPHPELAGNPDETESSQEPAEREPPAESAEPEQPEVTDDDD
ncbi:gas vesicle protein GvpJ [Haloarchaeobius amylolyticus]|uniref:gas vesicle protein GvpJ n=1 Tax=Haloarchaeobius amylolyticus TaxID=1198296 RepID=UPI0026E5693B|nr:gas vesicle protein [Haloarchaeobius amylolyticus]